MLKNLTKKQAEIMKQSPELRAYTYNFGEPVIERVNGVFFIYPTQTEYSQGHYVNFAHSLDYLKGWLYGCVQSVNILHKPVPKKALPQGQDLEVPEFLHNKGGKKVGK